MGRVQLHELPKVNLTSDTIDNCFFVQDVNRVIISYVPLRQVFDELIERAKREGLTIELINDEKIVIKSVH